MDNIKATIYLKTGSFYTYIFFNEIELDTYFEDNQHLIEKIETE
jgi:hypothetical protein